MTTPTGQGRVDEHPGSVRQSAPRSDPPARPTPWLGVGSAPGAAAETPGNGAGHGAAGQAEWFEADLPTQPFPAVREPRTSREGSHSLPGAPVRQAPALRDVPVRDIAQAPAPPVVRPAAPARAGAPAAGTVQASAATQNAVTTQHAVVEADDAPPWPARPRGPWKIPGPIKTSFRWWVVALALAILAMALSIVLAVMYAGRYGTAPAGGATVGSVLFEVLMLGAAGFVVVRMRAGDDWARTVLAAGGGLIALIVAMNTAGQFSFGSSMVAGFTTGIATLRLLEAVAAAVAIWYMFQPGAGDHFDPRRREG